MTPETLELLNSALVRVQLISATIRDHTNKVIGAGDLMELIRHYDQLRDINAQVKKARQALDDIEDHLSHDDIPDAFKRAGIKTITVDDVGRVTVAYKWGCSIMDGKKPEALGWLRNSGNGGIIIETVNAQTLASFARTEVEEHGKTLPDDLFTTSLRPYTSITKV